MLTDTLSYNLDEVSIVGFYREDLKAGGVVEREFLQQANKGQEPSFILASRPSVIAYSDTGNEYGYSYFRVRGMDQTRVNMTLDGMPLNEGEDQGVYFSNYPDMLSSMHSMKVTNGASVSGNGVAGYAGSIDFESVDLQRDTVSSAYAGYGSWNTFKSSLEYNTGRLGRFAGHFKATMQQSDGYRRNSYNSSQSAFVKLGYFINDRHSLDLLSFIGFSRNGQAWIGSSPEELASDYRSNGCDETETDRFMQNISKLQYRGYLTDRLMLTASVYCNHLDGHYYFDVDNFMLKVVDPGWLATGEVERYALRHNMSGGNLAARWTCGPLRLTAGANASFFSRRHVGTNNIQDVPLWDNVGYKNDLNVFLKAEYSWNTLTAGANLQYRHADFAYDGEVPLEKVNWDFFNWSASLRWRFAEGHSLYASMTRTHREPTRSDMFGGEENLNSIVTTQAESVLDYELGCNLTAEGLIANVNLYYMDFSNELILNGEMGTNSLPIRVNAAQSYRSGVELTLTYSPLKRLVLRNSSSWSMNRVDTGEEVLTHVMSPSWIIRQDVSYGFFNVNIGASMNYRSRMFFDLTNNYEIAARTRFDLFAEYTAGRVCLGLHLNNVFDKRSYANGMLGAGGPLYFVEAPRNFFADVRIMF